MQLAKLSPIHHDQAKWQGQFAEHLGWQVVQWYSSAEKEMALARSGVAICDQTHRRKFRIEGDKAGAILSADDLAVHEGKRTTDGHIYRLRSDLFFMWIQAEEEGLIEKTFKEKADSTGSLITITDLTHGNAELWLIGPGSTELLNRLCGLDFHDNQFSNGQAKQSSLAKTTQLIIRHDLNNIPAYALIGGRSLAGYLWQTIFEAGEDFGLQPIGQKAFEKLTNDD